VHDGVVTSGTRARLHPRFIGAVVEEGERFGALATELAAGLAPAGAGLATRVPWVPAWSARDLVVHLGNVHRWATAIVTAGHADGPPPVPGERPADAELLDWYAAGLATLVTTLRTTPPDAPAWHMSPAAPKVAAEWARRQAHELAVHRMDLEAAAGVAHAPVEADLAEDGVDELLAVVVPRWAHTEPLRSAEAVVSVLATDTGREWEVRVDRGVVTVAADRSGTAGAHLEGRATQLLRRLWGRPADVRVTGDAAAEALLRGR
jgi:uncharacterized protein (TIGR03083 family)